MTCALLPSTYLQSVDHIIHHEDYDNDWTFNDNNEEKVPLLSFHYLPPCHVQNNSYTPNPNCLLCETWRKLIDEFVNEARSEINNENIFKQIPIHNCPDFISISSLVHQFSSEDLPKVSPDFLPLVKSTTCKNKRGRKRLQPDHQTMFSSSSFSSSSEARKKEQNRIAAQRYRSRKAQLKERNKVEIQNLEKKNEDLKVEKILLEERIHQVRQFITSESSSFYAFLSYFQQIFEI